MENSHQTNPREILSNLWIVLLFNMIFNDIFSIFIELDKFVRLTLPGDAKTFMLIAAFITNIPIMMIFASKFLKYKTNRALNIFVGFFTILYVWGGMSSYPHYIVVATIETILAICIIYVAWRLKNIE